MKCNECQSSNTIVAETRRHTDGAPMRRRKCLDCGHSFKTLEVVFDGGEPPAPKKVKPKAEPVVKPKPKEVKQIKIDARRKNEDRRSRVPDYFIEDDFDDGRW